MAAAQQTPDCNGPRGYKDFRRYSELSHRFNLIAGYKSSYGDSTLQKKMFPLLEEALHGLCPHLILKHS